MPIEDFLIDWSLEALKEGEIIRARSFEEQDKEIRPLQVNHARKLVKTLSDLYYSGKPPTKDQFNKLFEEHEKVMNDEVMEILDGLENSESFFKVAKRKDEKDGSITIKLEKINNEDRIKVIRSIAEKLVNKMTKEQLISMLEEGIKKNDSLAELKDIDADLDKNDVKVKGNKGCFKLIVNDKDIVIIR